MKNIFASNDDKLTEKAFMQSIAVSVFGILLCIIALTTATWAWFSDSVSSASNSIQSAYCDVSVSVTTGDGPVTADNGIYSFNPEIDYIITITATGTAKNAYCILKINGTDYYTENIPTPETNFTFTLRFRQETKVQVIPRWGTTVQEEKIFADGVTYTVSKDSNEQTTVITLTGP